MADLAKDVLPGINKVIEMGIADENRIGVSGTAMGVTLFFLSWFKPADSKQPSRSMGLVT